MADETLIDLEDLYEMLDDENAPRMQVWATVALCERLDVLNRHLGFYGDSIHEFLVWFQAVSPSR